MDKKYLGLFFLVVFGAAFYFIQKKPKKEVSKTVQTKIKKPQKAKDVSESLAKKDFKNLELKEYKKVGDRTLIGSDLSSPQEIPANKEYINTISKDWKEKMLGFMKEGSSYDRKIKTEVLGSHIISHENYLLNAESVKISYIQPDGSSASFKALINSSNGAIITTYDLVGVKIELEKDQFEGEGLATEEEIEKLTEMLKNDKDPIALGIEEHNQEEIEEINRGLAEVEKSEALAKSEDQISEEVQKLNKELLTK